MSVPVALALLNAASCVGPSDDPSSGEYQYDDTEETTASSQGATVSSYLCRACTANSDCGTGGRCLTSSTNGRRFCGTPCGIGCPTSFTCREVWARRTSSYQCVPTSGVCSATDAGVADVPRDTGAVTDTGVRDAGAVTDTGVRDTGAVTDTGGATDAGGAASGGALVAFPGAEGFGAAATGGRGGAVVFVTTLAASGPGSLNAALSMTGARTVIFRVSGVIEGSATITQGDVTIAGQTSPAGVTIHGGLYCDNTYDPYHCNNVIVRHLRARQPGDDCLRIGGADRVIVDHCSFANARDESVEVSRSQNVTVQYSSLAEPVGDHYHYGGLLVNYSKTTLPLDRLTFHHNVWNGVFGRVPELSCEENSDGVSGTSNCAGRTLRAEISNNLVFDSGDPLYYNRCVGVNAGNDCGASPSDFLLGLNWVGNVTMRRSSISQPMFVPDVSRNASNSIFYTDNLVMTGAASTAGTTTLASRASRQPWPTVTVQSAASLRAALQASAGAFPRDPMDTRLMGYLSGTVDARPASWANGVGIDRGDALRTNTALSTAAPVDTDNDGMPDDWERANGTNPSADDHNGTGLSTRLAGVAGYTNLECYLNQLSAQRISTNR